jgi:hypothetical protein
MASDPDAGGISVPPHGRAGLGKPGSIPGYGLMPGTGYNMDFDTGNNQNGGRGAGTSPNSRIMTPSSSSSVMSEQHVRNINNDTNANNRRSASQQHNNCTGDGTTQTDTIGYFGGPASAAAAYPMQGPVGLTNISSSATVGPFEFSQPPWMTGPGTVVTTMGEDMLSMMDIEIAGWDDN